MKILLFVLMIFLVASCTAFPGGGTPPPDTAVTSPPADNMPTDEPSPNPLVPQPGDEQLLRGEVFIHEASLVIRESYPPQISLSISGDLPTPCHGLRAAISAPDQENKIAVDVYSVVDPNVACIQILEPFEEQIDLGTFPAGHYSVWVNGELVGEFDS